jgi:hypothetical protein
MMALLLLLLLPSGPDLAHQWRQLAAGQGLRWPAVTWQSLLTGLNHPVPQQQQQQSTSQLKTALLQQPSCGGRTLCNGLCSTAMSTPAMLSWAVQALTTW